MNINKNTKILFVDDESTIRKEMSIIFNKIYNNVIRIN